MKFKHTLQQFFLPFILVFFALVIAFGGGYWVRPWIDQAVNPEYPILNRVLSILQERGLKDMPAQKTVEHGMIKGLIQAYDDPFTIFVEPAQARLQNDELQGHYGGIGSRLERDGENHLILFPFPNSPASQAGLLDGDRLVQVDDLAVLENTGVDVVESALRGPVGQGVRLTVQRPPDYASQLVIVKRADVGLPTTTWNLAPQDPRVGIVRLSVVAATSADEIQAAVKDLQQRGATHFVLDLRNNGGGLLDAGVDIARLFLKQGEVIRQQYRGEPVKDYTVQRPGPLADLPVAVWVNQNTASAAEIIAGSLQAQKRARLVGSNTYGKDSIQLVFNLEDGSSLHVTAARWWIPGFENSIHGHGLQPDQAVQDDPANNTAFVQATKQIFGLQ